MRRGTTTFRLVALMTAALSSSDLLAQMGANYGASNSYHDAPARGSAIQALFTTPFRSGGGSDYVDAHGNPAVVPAGFHHAHRGPYGGGYQYAGPPCPPPCADGCYAGQCPDCYGGYGGGYCPDEGGMGTYPPFEDGLENFSLLPPGRTEQCGPHYFDVRMEAVTMTRDEAFRQNVDFTALNVAGPIVLSSRQLDFDYETGFRVLGRYDIGPLTVLEFGYWGLENLDSSVSFTDPDPVNENTGNLYSLFTDFVRNPADLPVNVTQPGGALPWTERSITHTISLESELHNAEMNCRRYWVGYNPAVSGTLLCGFRFTRLREDFQFSASGEAQGAYLESIKNDMAGFQTGGDVWLHVRQGLRIGAESKVGLVNNHYTLENSFSTNPAAGSPPTFSERFEKDQPALIVDSSVDVVCDLCPSWSIRAGYEILFLNSVLLAGENFNSGTVYNGIPGVELPERVPFVNDQGNAFYHGGHLGMEFTW